MDRREFYFRDRFFFFHLSRQNVISRSMISKKKYTTEQFQYIFRLDEVNYFPKISYFIMCSFVIDQPNQHPKATEVHKLQYSE